MEKARDILTEKKKTVRAVDRALHILICFIDKHELSLTEISRKVGLNKSTVYRLLSSLEGKGFLQRNEETEKYRLGFRIWELSTNLTREDDPAVLFKPEMERLRDGLGETISLYVRDGHERIRVQAVESNETIRRVAPVGARLPLYVGASSKVLVAYADAQTQREIMEDPAWPDSIDRQWYRKQLKDIQDRGYATSLEEREAGTSAVAAPVFSRSGRLISALSVSGPASRFTLQTMKSIAPEVIEGAEKMGKMLQ